MMVCAGSTSSISYHSDVGIVFDDSDIVSNCYSDDKELK